MAKGADAKWQKIQDNVTKKLQDMVKRGRSARAFISRRVVPKYKEFQMQRWASEDQGKWPSLTSATYIAWKLRKYSNAIGQGSRMMIASGELIKSVLVQSGSHGRMMVTDRSLVIVIGDLKYAGYANDVRNFTKFPPLFVRDLRVELANYITKGKL